MKDSAIEVPTSVPELINWVGGILGHDVHQFAVNLQSGMAKVRWRPFSAEEKLPGMEGEDLEPEVDALIRNILDHLNIREESPVRSGRAPEAVVACMQAMSLSRRYAHSWVCASVDMVRKWVGWPETVQLDTGFMGLPIYQYNGTQLSDPRMLILLGSKVVGGSLRTISDARRIIMQSVE